MEQETTRVEAPDPPGAATRELVRPVEGRVIAGVAQGFANRFDIPAWLIRVGFVLFTFAGGIGVVAYAACWFLIRSEDEADTPAERVFSGASSTQSWIGIGLVLLAVLLLLDNFTFLSGGVVWAVGLLVVGVLLYTGDLPGLITRERNKKEDTEVPPTEAPPQDTKSELVDADTPAGTPPPAAPPPTPAPPPPTMPPAAREPKETSILGRLTIGAMLLGVGILALLDAIPDFPIYPEPRHYMALAVTILGVGLLVGTIWGRARWLIIVAVVLVPTLFFSPVFEFEWTSETFDQRIEVTTFEELEDGFDIDIGNLVIDLRELPWSGEEVELFARVDAGNLEVIVPDDVGITGTASVDIGRVAAPGRESSGIGNPNLTFDFSGPDGNVDLDLHVDVGNIDVRIRD